MNTKKTTISTALMAVLALGFGGEASASFYARSYLEIDNMNIQISDNGGTSPGGATVTSFNFTTSDTANLNNTGLVGNSNTCGGSVASNTCSSVGNVLDSAPANGTGSAPLRTENDYSFFGPGTNQYSNADAVIYASELTSAGANPTHTEQIAESELQSGTSALSSSKITSTTNLNMAFVATGANQISISFDTIASVISRIQDAGASAGSALADIGFEFALSKDNTNIKAIWNPDGTNSGCLSSASLVCVVTSNFDINSDSSVGWAPGISTGATNRTGAGSHTLLVTGLTDGAWTLSLTAATGTTLTRQPVQAPEPGMILLLATGLLGLGFNLNRRRVRM